jgi:hypothetical protein
MKPRSLLSDHPQVIYNNEDLVPKNWMESGRQDEGLAFNPSIARFGNSILMAYRVVLPDMRRRIALCRLDASFKVVKDSLIPLSDHLTDCGDWHADPRFCVYGTRLFLHFNNGMGHDHGPNRIYMVEIDPDDLLPIRAPQPLELAGVRRRIEKNWMPFEHEGEILAVYSIEPHIILRCVLGETGPVQCRPVHQRYWDSSAYTGSYGVMRGSTPPTRLGDAYFSFHHSVYPVRTLRNILQRMLTRRSLYNLNYVGGFYGFSARPPFTPIRFTPAPVLWPPGICRYSPRQMDPRIHKCAYISGAILVDDQWIVSYGAQNNFSCLKMFRHHDLMNSMVRCEASRQE